uniref:Ral GTPase-activating protein subunit alpha-1-like isoform X3 n=1 Tax=Petromyzon marinus TaxID=7757 RepID=A0AAJ7WPP3_PETMA|nr:ral GTPase-activating protein subunit alpha-1-like isoform X3 [Petromyzon marinus]
MFSKKTHGDAKKSAQKLLDIKKDAMTRLKHLRVVLAENTDTADLKLFFDTNYSQIYFVFFENFVSIEANLKQKAHKSQREELESILFIFEKILQLLPERIQNKWQFHSIGLILKKLLHTGNSIKLRREGVRLFLLWMQALQHNCSDELLLMYACLIPGFPLPAGEQGGRSLDSLINPCLATAEGAASLLSASLLWPLSPAFLGPVCAEEITPLVSPQSNEQIPEDLTCYLLEVMLKYMVIQARGLEWKNKENHEKGFAFLLNIFKKYYLPFIFPSFCKETSLYSPNLEVPLLRAKPQYVQVGRDVQFNEPSYSTREPLLSARVVLIKWLVNFWLELKPPLLCPAVPEAEGESMPKIIQRVAAGLAGRVGGESGGGGGATGAGAGIAGKVETDSAGEAEPGNSNTSTLTERTPSVSSLSSATGADESLSDSEVARSVLCSSRENANFVSEVFRQAFLLPFTEAAATRRVVKVYQEWIQSQEKPAFMREPAVSAQPKEDAAAAAATGVAGAAGDVERSPSGGNKPAEREEQQAKQPRAMGHERTPSWTRTNSYQNAINRLEEGGSVHAGMQPTLQVFLTHSVNVFLLEPSCEISRLMSEQVDLCKRVLNIYRHMVMYVSMEKRTWEQLLQVLLRITESIFQSIPPQGLRQRTLAGRLAGPVFQTLIVAWIKASLSVQVSRELWDRLLEALSGLTRWPELVAEWAKTMETLTKVLARQVYGLDLADLPLDKLSEQKLKKHRGRGAGPEAKKATVDRSFSRSWSRDQFPAGFARRRSVTTSGASPGGPGKMSGGYHPKTTGLPSRLPGLGNGVPPSHGIRSVKSAPVLFFTFTPFFPDFFRNPFCGSLRDVPEMESPGTSTRARHHSQGEDRLAGQLGTVQENSLVRSSSAINIAMQAHSTAQQEEKHSHSRSRSAESPSGREAGRARELETKSLLDCHHEGKPSEASPSRSPAAAAGAAAAAETGDGHVEGAALRAAGYPPQYDRHSFFEEGEHAVSDALPADHLIQFPTKDYSFAGDGSPLEVSCAGDGLEEDRASLNTMNIDSETSSLGQHNPAEAVAFTGSESTSLTNSGSCSRSHTPSPSPDTEPCESKDSPPALDEGLHNSVLQLNGELDDSELEDCSVIAGGTMTGWHADVATVLWRRMLGALGDINAIPDPDIHAQVLDYLCELWDSLAKIRDNLGISLDNQCTPEPPDLIPPLTILTPWLFKATTLPDQYKQGKLHAYRLICKIMMRRQELHPSTDFLVHFYAVIHSALLSSDQDVLSVVMRNCSPHFFSLGLPGSSMLLWDFLLAASRIATSQSSQAPRAETQSLLGSLVCFPNLYGEMPALHPTLHDITPTDCEGLKEQLVKLILNGAKEEPSETARCIALCSLGIWICEELVHCTRHPLVTDAIHVICATLKFSHRSVAQVSCDMLTVLAMYADDLQQHSEELPSIIVQALVSTITQLLPVTEISSQEEEKKRMVSLLLCLLDWCMVLTLPALLQPAAACGRDPGERRPSLLSSVFKVLHGCVHGSAAFAQPGYAPLGPAEAPASAGHDTQASPEDRKDRSEGLAEQSASVACAPGSEGSEHDPVPLAAWTVMVHLLTHLGHYPMGGGPALLASLLTEGHENPCVSGATGAGGDDCIGPELFSSPNLQLFVLSHADSGGGDSLLSFVQLPLSPGRSSELAGLQTPACDVRFIARDVSGKYTWDSTLLYGVAQPDGGLAEGAFGGTPPAGGDWTIRDPAPGGSEANGGQSERAPASGGNRLPTYDSLEGGEDALDSLLRYVGQSSPECLPGPGLPLHVPSVDPPAPLAEPGDETLFMECLRRQSQAERAHLAGEGQLTVSSCSANAAAPQTEPEPTEPSSTFYYCRLLLNDLGLLSWDKRGSFDLLKKNEKLLRELKNLDSQYCRETHKIAVLFVAEGQEDKHSILSNAGGSQSYEDFLAGLGWEVDLTRHCGFLGGLQRNGSNGLTAPYYATSTVEVIYHVSTRMPSDTDDALTKKLRHLGNDEVHVVWCEHTREYRRDIIPTEFRDVLIVIYPLRGHTFRICIMKKTEVPFFGPLFDGAIVGKKLLPGLVRATAINASRALKRRLPLYRSFYEERSRYLEAIVKQQREVSTFEDLAAQVYSPAMCRPLSCEAANEHDTSREVDSPAEEADCAESVSKQAHAQPFGKHRRTGRLRRITGAVGKS